MLFSVVVKTLETQVCRLNLKYSLAIYLNKIKIPLNAQNRGGNTKSAAVRARCNAAAREATGACQARPSPCVHVCEKPMFHVCDRPAAGDACAKSHCTTPRFETRRLR